LAVYIAVENLFWIAAATAADGTWPPLRGVMAKPVPPAETQAQRSGSWKNR